MRLKRTRPSPLAWTCPELVGNLSLRLSLAVSLRCHGSPIDQTPRWWSLYRTTWSPSTWACQTLNNLTRFVKSSYRFVCHYGMNGRCEWEIRIHTQLPTSHWYIHVGTEQIRESMEIGKRSTDQRQLAGATVTFSSVAMFYRPIILRGVVTIKRNIDYFPLPHCVSLAILCVCVCVCVWSPTVYNAVSHRVQSKPGVVWWIEIGCTLFGFFNECFVHKSETSRYVEGQKRQNAWPVRVSWSFT